MNRGEETVSRTVSSAGFLLPETMFSPVGGMVTHLREPDQTQQGHHELTNQQTAATLMRQVPPASNMMQQENQHQHCQKGEAPRGDTQNGREWLA